MIAALYVDPVGPYYGHPGFDPWDEKRDARRYPGPHPVIAHPPCERWGRFAEGSPGAKNPEKFKLGDDGGCFLSALEAVRTWGGVLEHPQGTNAFHSFRLPIPSAGNVRSDGWTVADEWGGRSCHVDQGRYGHKAQKPTWLYACLPAFPRLDWRRAWDMPYRIGGNGYHSKKERARAKASTTFIPRLKPDLPEGERHLTPARFGEALQSLAASCHGWRPRRSQIQASLIEVPDEHQEHGARGKREWCRACQEAFPKGAGVPK